MSTTETTGGRLPRARSTIAGLALTMLLLLMWSGSAHAAGSAPQCSATTDLQLERPRHAEHRLVLRRRGRTI